MDLTPTTPVQVINKGDEEFAFEFKREQYRLGPNETQFWPWEVACHLLGDPAIENTTTYPHRDGMLLQVQNLLGGAGRLNKDDGRSGTLSEPIKWDEWKSVQPAIEVQEMRGKKIQMASQTPDTDAYNPGLTQADMQDKMAQLEAQLSMLKQAAEDDDSPLVVTETAQEEQVTTLDELPEDGGPKTRPNKRVTS